MLQLCEPEREVHTVKSINFDFIAKSFPELAELGGFAEHYIHEDPKGALVKLRMFAELMVKRLYAEYGLELPNEYDLKSQINSPEIRKAIPTEVTMKLDAIRMNGNQGAHGDAKGLKPISAKWLIKEAYQLAKWLHIAIANGAEKDIPEYVEVEKKPSSAELKAQLEEREKKLIQLEIELEKALQEKSKTKKSDEQLALQLEQNKQSVSALKFDEKTTRDLLIDQLLRYAKWDVAEGENNTSEVSKEEPVKFQPTESGIGYADYVIWDDNGKPLAVVEAKNTSLEALKGQHQAALYADGLEKEHNQRPVIFLTNGHDIWIWDDAKGEPPRKIYGFYSKASLHYLFFQTAQRKATLSHLSPKPQIVDRLYQVEAIKRICEKFDKRSRKAMLVQATGTGKTRIAVALSELMLRARWAKRILFLCDRRELRKQAKNAYVEHMPECPWVYVGKDTHNDTDHSLHIGTYQGMDSHFHNYDVGYFDLIICDEAHRTIYKRYQDLFKYFDTFQVGLTATPVNFIERNTYSLFGCPEGDPTAHYSLEEAIEQEYLVPFRVTKHTTKFLREGIKYDDLDDQQREQLEDQVEDPEAIDYSAIQVDKSVFNKDTDRAIIRNLMENGVRNADGIHVGKTIIFARNQEHARILNGLFDEMYPQYGGKFCSVIHSKIDRAEELIEDFKKPLNELTIAISVDMLDTGIDVPEVVNLVFAKPVGSKVKFWQMIGRGTRLCPDLFGPGKHKEYFQIFDHWGNFEHFEALSHEGEPSVAKSLMQRLFEARLNLAEAAIAKQNQAAMEIALRLVKQDVNALPDNSIAVKEKWRAIEKILLPDIIEKYSGATRDVLRQDIASLMQWRSLEGYSAAYKFDYLIARIASAHLKESGGLEDLKGDLINWVSGLPININQVKDKKATIDRVKSSTFWNNITVSELEEVREQLRMIMYLVKEDLDAKPDARVIDISERDEISEEHAVHFDTPYELIAYRKRVKDVFQQLFDANTALKKIKAGLPVTSEEITELAEHVVEMDEAINLEDLLKLYPRVEKLELAIRQVIGMDSEAVKEFFSNFEHKYSEELNPHQLQFLQQLKDYIARHGIVEVEQLWQNPFTKFDKDGEGITGVFEEKENQVDEIIDIIHQLNFAESDH